MKKLIIIALALVLSLGLAGIASATVVNSLHDFSNAGTNPSKTNDGFGVNTGQVCVFCHHPHRGANATLGNDLLWNMNSVGSANITGYSSATMNATTAAVNATAPQSFLCMTCHDGVVAVGALVQKPKDTVNNTTADWWNDPAANSAANLSSTLADDHPVNFTYTDASSVDTGIKAPLANTVTGNLSANPYPLFAGTMQCATCHDVHAGTPDGTDSKDLTIQFMRGDTAASEICVDCHINK